MKSPAPSTIYAVHNRPSDLDAQLGKAWLTRLVGWCFGSRREAPAPADLTGHVTVLGIPNARFLVDSQGASLAKELEQLCIENGLLWRSRKAGTGACPRRISSQFPKAVTTAHLAGLICGWSDTGTMPVFTGLRGRPRWISVRKAPPILDVERPSDHLG
jgi:hypothetical protein